MKNMDHPERKAARSYDLPGRSRTFTDIVYSGEGNAAEKYAALTKAEHMFDPPAPKFDLFIGEMHGHTRLSDGDPSIDDYFINLRDVAKVDFAAVSDHDHGGVGKPELWVGSPSKWDMIREKVKEYNEPGKFTTILAYERDSYPYYNNMIVYYKSHDGEMIRGVRDGEITAEELRDALSRDDILLIPHDTYYLSAGADLSRIPLSLLTPLIEIYSRGDAAEYMGNPANGQDSLCEGGWWQDALKRGAHMGCIAGSDDHFCKNGLITDAPYPFNYPGLTGVWRRQIHRKLFLKRSRHEDATLSWAEGSLSISASTAIGWAKFLRPLPMPIVPFGSMSLPMLPSRKSPSSRIAAIISSSSVKAPCSLTTAANRRKTVIICALSWKAAGTLGRVPYGSRRQMTPNNKGRRCCSGLSRTISYAHPFVFFF